MRYSVILIFLISSGCYSQEFVKGFIFSSSGDTTNGFIKLNSYATNYKICVFKKDSGSATLVYTPYNLAGYGCKDFLYHSKEIVENNIVVRIFAEVLLDGTFNLIKYKSFLIEKRDSIGIISLKRRMDAESRDPLKRFAYKQLLQILTADCQSIVSELKNLKFSEQGILNYIERYHQCKNYTYKVYKNNLPWTVFSWWPFVGYHVSSLSSSDFFRKNDLNAAISYSPQIGSSFQFKFPRTNKNLTFIVDIIFSKSLYTSQTMFDGLGEAYTYEYLTLKLKTLKIPIGISLPIHARSGLQIEGGTGFNFFGGDPQFTYESFFNDQVFISHQIEKGGGLRNSFFIGLRHKLSFSKFQIPMSLRIDHTPKFTFRTSTLTSAYLTIGLKRLPQ